jgi:predicted nucleotidyltransferase
MQQKALTRDEILGQLRKHKPELEKQFGVKALALVESSVHEQTTEGSSVDVLVTFNAPATVKTFFGTQFYIEDLLELRVDLITEKYIPERWKLYYQARAVYV